MCIFFSRYKLIWNTLLLPSWVSVFAWTNRDTGTLICLCLFASVFCSRVMSSFRILFGCLLGEAYLPGGTETLGHSFACVYSLVFFSSRYKFIWNTLLLPPWVSVFTWRNADTGALICLCLIASVFSSRYKFISNTLLLPPWVSVFTCGNGDTAALICLCFIASVFFLAL